MPTTSDPTTRAQGFQAVVLALVAGYVDAFTLLNFQVYTSFMSGNTTQGGLHAGEGQLAEAGYRLLPIPLFVLGVAIGTLLLEGPRRWRVHWLWGAIAALLAASAATTVLGSVAHWCDVVMLSFAMGLMNTSITRVGGQTVSLGFVTGDLNNLGRHLALAAGGVPLADSQASWDSRWWRTGVLAGVWGSFLIGAMISGATMLVAGKWTLLPPTVVLAWLALFGRDVGPSATVNRQPA